MIVIVFIDAANISIGELCGDHSYLGEIAFQNEYQYKTWVLQDHERNFVAATLWQG
jgi:hypothetical protein